MIQRCPHCDIIHLDEEWKTGVCVSCDRPLFEVNPSEPQPQPEPPKRKSNGFRLYGAVLLLFALGTGVIWHLSRPESTDNQDAVADTTNDPEKKPEPLGPVQQPEVKLRPTPEPMEVLPGQPVEVKKPPVGIPEEKPQPFDKEKAVAFALEIMTASEILTKKYYRTLDEDRLIEWAIRGLFEAAKEKVPPALEQRLRKKAPDEGIHHLDLLVDAREMLGLRKELLAPQDADAALQAIFRRLDPHTTLLKPDALTRLNLIQNGSMVGELGVLIRRLPQSEIVEVVTPYKDGPAYKAGIRAGDTITRVRQLDGPEGQPLKEPEEIAPGKLSEEEAGCASWGRLGSRVEVTFRHSGGEQLQVATLVRSKVKKEKILGLRRNADDSWDHVLDPAAGIYYVRISDFHGPETARELDQLLKGFKQPLMKGLVLDLRFTGSGLIQTAFDIADLFVPKGLIVEFRSRNLVDGKGNWMSRGKPSHATLPIVCLVNTEAGTCTEIVAAALQDHQRARIVGERTSGKASAQNYFPTERGTLRITTSCAHRPNGKPLDRILGQDILLEKAGPGMTPAPSDEWGVTPDKSFVVPLTDAERNALRERFLTHVRLHRRGTQGSEPGTVADRQLDKAQESLVRDMK